MAEARQRTVGLAAVIPIMAIYALGASQGGVNAGTATMALAFPEAGANISYVVSMVALGMIPACVVSGMVTGRYVGYRASIILSLILYLAAGLAPAFFPEGTPFWALLATRFVFGLAVGWSYPLGQALIFKLYANEDKRASMMGIGMVFFNVGQIVMSFAAGYLAAVSWQACFYVYLIGIVPLVAVLFLFKEPESDAAQAEQEGGPEGEQAAKASIPPIAWAFMILLGLCNAFAMPTLLYSSFAIGDPAMAGIVLSVFTIIGAVSSATLGPLYKAAGKWAVPVSAVALAVCFILCGVSSASGATNVPLFVGALLVGSWGYTLVIPAITNAVTNLVSVAAATRVMGFNTAFMQAGSFLSTPIAALIMSMLGLGSVVELILPCSICLGLCAVVLTVMTARADFGSRR